MGHEGGASCYDGSDCLTTAERRATLGDWSKRMQSNSCWYRSMLQCSLVVAVLVAAYSDVHSQDVLKASNPVVLENQLPGSTDWQLTRVRVDGSRYRSPWIEGYCSKQSVKAGEAIDIKVSTNPARPFRL